MSDELPDPRTVRIDPCPEGYRYEWVVESARWRVIDPDQAKRCRWTDAGVRCEAMSVAKLDRSQTSKRPEQWWHYCGDHLFGRRVSGRRVWVIHAIRDDDEVSG